VIPVSLNNRRLRLKRGHSGNRTVRATQIWWCGRRIQETVPFLTTRPPDGLRKRTNLWNIGGMDKPCCIPSITGEMCVDCGAQQRGGLEARWDWLNQAFTHCH